MKEKQMLSCLYSVVRFIEDPIRNEPRNIGIILQCIEEPYVNCRFVADMKSKLSGVATSLDVKVLKAYVQDFEQKFEHYKTRETPLFDNQEPFLNHEYLDNLSKSASGKIQYSRPKGCLTKNPDEELDYLFRAFVQDQAIISIELPKRTRLKTELKRQFHYRNLLVRAKSEEGFKPDAILTSHISGASFRVDFAMQNGTTCVVETVDLRIKRPTEQEHVAFSAAYKMADLSAQAKLRYSVVAVEEGHEGYDSFLKALGQNSDVVMYHTEKDNFLEQIELLVHKSSRQSRLT